jgi:hypothetical protein
MVDIAFFGEILLHLRDPLLAMPQFARRTRETLIITDTLENLGHLTELPIMLLRAGGEAVGPTESSRSPRSAPVRSRIPVQTGPSTRAVAPR